MSRNWFFALAFAAALGAGCSLFDNRDDEIASPKPSASGVQQLAGTWASISSTTALPSTCTSFRWTVTEFSGTSGSGTFTATCLSGMAIAGTATGALSGDKITWSATATGTSNGSTCPITLSGSATLESSQIRVPYTGTVCGTAVEGIEILRQ
ncbi:MAG TPA: hypothetical protein VFO19_03575 [Vicinamibacterales bacterium]|nr:hypothetical protein [Vicinamibacterales bacterium]